MPSSSTPLGSDVAAARSTAVELPMQNGYVEFSACLLEDGVCSAVFDDSGDKVVLVQEHEAVEAHVSVLGFRVFHDGYG